MAILTSEPFDALTVDPASVCFGADPGSAEASDCSEAQGGSHAEDVDEDGDLDLVLHYETSETGIESGDAQACLQGETVSGSPFGAFRGCDTIRTR